MLLNLHKKSWMEGLTLQDYSEHCKLNETVVKEMLELAKNYNKVFISCSSSMLGLLSIQLMTCCTKFHLVKWITNPFSFIHGNILENKYKLNNE